MLKRLVRLRSLELAAMHGVSDLGILRDLRDLTALELGFWYEIPAYASAVGLLSALSDSPCGTSTSKT